MEYAYSDNEESFCNRCATLAEALESALDDYPDDESVWVGEVEQKTIGSYFGQGDAENILEALAQQAGEECGECADSWLEGPRCPRSTVALPKDELKAKHEAFRTKKKEWTVTLVDDIRAALEKWATENGEQPGFYHVRNVKHYSREEAEIIINAAFIPETT